MKINTNIASLNIINLHLRSCSCLKAMPDPLRANFAQIVLSLHLFVATKVLEPHGNIDV